VRFHHERHPARHEIDFALATGDHRAAVPAPCYLLILAFGWYARRPLQRG
jgi:hypothetical protein